MTPSLTEVHSGDLYRRCVAEASPQPRDQVAEVEEAELVARHSHRGHPEARAVEKAAPGEGAPDPQSEAQLAQESSGEAPGRHDDRHGVAGQVQGPVSSAGGHQALLPGQLPAGDRS